MSIEQAENEILKVLVIATTIGISLIVFTIARCGTLIAEQLKRIADKEAYTLYVSNCDVRRENKLTEEPASNNDILR